MTLGRAIEQAMKRSRVQTQTALADALGVDQKTVSRMINGLVPNIAVDRVAEIERICELPRGQILTWAGYVEPDEVEQLAGVTDLSVRAEQARRARALADETAQRLAAAEAGRARRATKAPTRRPAPPVGRD